MLALRQNGHRPRALCQGLLSWRTASAAVRTVAKAPQFAVTEHRVGLAVIPDYTHGPGAFGHEIADSGLRAPPVTAELAAARRPQIGRRQVALAAVGPGDGQLASGQRERSRAEASLGQVRGGAAVA